MQIYIRCLQPGVPEVANHCSINTLLLVNSTIVLDSDLCLETILSRSGDYPLIFDLECDLEDHRTATEATSHLLGGTVRQTSRAGSYSKRRSHP